MATTGHGRAAGEHDTAAALADAGFVRVTAAPTGGSVAAAATLAGACAERGVPFQVRVARRGPAPDVDAVSRDVDAGTDAETDAQAVTHLTVGVDAPDAAAAFADAAPNEAFDVARAAGADPDPVLAFAGALADGVGPSSGVHEAAGLNQRPGVGVPTADLATGLAHTTRLHASFSGDEQAAGATLADLDLPAEPDEAAHRRLASVVALDATDGATERAADAVADALRPHETPDGPFETVEGFADVLGALAWDAPGLAVALALGSADRAAAVDAWKAHARDAHAAVREADPTRHRGVVVAEATDAHPTVARLLRDFRAEEPVVLVVGGGVAALATTEVDARDLLPGGVGTPTLAVTETGDGADAGVDDAGADDAGADELDADALVETVKEAA